MNKITQTVKLSNGIEIPRVGLGVMFIDQGGEMQSAIDTAIDAGYRLFDNAPLYGNEAGVGEAIRRNGISRDKVFVSTKLSNKDQPYEKALKAFDESLKRFGFDYLDMYLIHWPCPEHDKYCEAWKALEHLYKEGYVRAIGLSNFHPEHIDRILDICEIPPMVNQLECNPYLSITELRSYCHSKNIWPEAWFPLGGPAVPLKGDVAPGKKLLEDPVLYEIAEEKGKTAAQIVLRWEIQSEIITIPKSSKAERIRENIGIFDFELTDEEMARIDALNCDRRVGPHPDTLNELF